MVFVVLIVSFTAVIANIAKTFRIKNQLINYVEQYNYDGSGSGEAIDAIEEYISVAGYQRVDDKDLRDKCESAVGGVSGYWNDYYGYCIRQIGDGERKYFRVTVYASVSLPFLNLNMSMPVSGESKTVVTLD